MDWLKAIYDVLGAPYPKSSLLIAIVLGAIVFGSVWALIGREYRKTAFHSNSERQAVEAVKEQPPKDTAEPERSPSLVPSPSPSASVPKSPKKAPLARESPPDDGEDILLGRKKKP